MAFSDEWNIIETCNHGVRWGHYCPQCWRWEKELREEAYRLRIERERSQTRTGD
jgi:hypothetical protein